MLVIPGLFQSTSSITVSPLSTVQGGPTVPSQRKFCLYGYADLRWQPMMSASCIRPWSPQPPLSSLSPSLSSYLRACPPPPC